MAWVGGDLKDYLVPPPCHGPAHLALDQAAQSLIQPSFERFRGGAATDSLDNLCQGFTTLTAKNFCHISNLNFPTSYLIPLLLVLSYIVFFFFFSLF